MAKKERKTRRSNQNIMRRMGQLIRARRIKERYRVRDVATFLGRSKAWVYMVERGDFQISYHLLYELARFFGADPAEFLPAPPWVKQTEDV